MADRKKWGFGLHSVLGLAHRAFLTWLRRPLKATRPVCAEASQPEDWDGEEDGEWEPPKVPNPACKEGPGCGEWKRPLKPNPDYKGKWTAPLIDNPDYKVGASLAANVRISKALLGIKDYVAVGRGSAE
jgi:hypothetical protein